MQYFTTSVVSFLAVLSLAAAGPGSIKVRNRGGNMATFTLDYDMNGQRESKSSGNFPLDVNKEIQIPNGATNITLKVEEYWSYPLKTTVFTKSFNSPVRKCYKIEGTTFSPLWKEVAC
ncbi:hypothetical protein V9T40_002320 [Parthenolecanium corni]|uniref:Uncharacterized protein n=1 Tax=Parthenolecanium corni TaxID=536013 RepID=A0AAN9TG24_9HEMI